MKALYVVIAAIVCAAVYGRMTSGPSQIKKYGHLEITRFARVSQDRVLIAGMTDLPDRSNVEVWYALPRNYLDSLPAELKSSPQINMTEAEVTTVQSGRFQQLLFFDNRFAAWRNYEGLWDVMVDFAPNGGELHDSASPKEVLNLVGYHGENLKGKYVRGQNVGGHYYQWLSLYTKLPLQRVPHRSSGQEPGS